MEVHFNHFHSPYEVNDYDLIWMCGKCNGLFLKQRYGDGSDLLQTGNGEYVCKRCYKV